MRCSTIDFIKQKLQITDKHLTITEMTCEMLHQKQHLVIKVTLSPYAHACTSCGSSVTDDTAKTVIVKNDTGEVKKPRYTCKNCNIIGLHKVTLFVKDILFQIRQNSKLSLY